MTKESAVALLSGGLDSATSLAVSLENYDVKLCLFFDYCQRSVEKERYYSKKLSEYYNIAFKEININWLAEITATALVNRDAKVPEYNLNKLDAEYGVLKESAMAVWVPNRNGVMINIAAAFAESYNCQYVIFGANSEEASTFPDNSIDYVNKASEALSYSTKNGVKVLSPLADKTKREIVDMAMRRDLPFDLIWSCYYSKEKHCGTCESCNRLRRALNANNIANIWSKIAF